MRDLLSKRLREHFNNLNSPPSPELPPGSGIILEAATELMFIRAELYRAQKSSESIDRLRRALNDAINSPKGVVPDSALEFWDGHAGRVKKT
jgi:hypothetical protein